MEKSFVSTQKMVLIALMTAITCIMAPFSLPIPFSPVPISLTNLVICISIFVLDYKAATLSYIIYLLLGLAGLPIFSGFTGGFGKLAGPTGGYLIGFIFLALIAGLFVDKAQGRYRYVLYVVGMVLGSIVTYAFGTIWLAKQMNLTFVQGLAAGVIPYLPGDILKIVIAMVIGPVLKRRLRNLQ